jgi:flagellar motor protein MotB
MHRSSWKRVVGSALIVAVAWASVGCSGVKKGEYDEVIAENNELRGQLASLEGERAMWLDTKSKLEQENADLAAALEQMKASGAVGPEGQIGEATMYMRDKDVVVQIAGDVLFDSGSANLKSSAKRTLDQVADVLRQQFGGNPIRVEGHSDADPIRKSNWKSNEHLSFERALAVEKYLASRGVASTAMYSAGFGPDKPRGTKAQSRRVEIVVLGG